MSDQIPSESNAGRPAADIALIIALVSTLYFARLTALPIVGEESRWARGAVQMLETGDWVVPRQQGRVFPERPPAGSWMMVVVGSLRGGVDTMAVRLPSVLAVLSTSLLIYAYARNFLSGLGPLAAALAFATMGQVLQIGRMGESESLFTLLLSSSLLVWHAGTCRNWPTAATWTLGFSLAALAALVKGPQAPAYFVAITGLYTVWQGRWRELVSPSYILGCLAFLAIVAAWQIPFYLRTDWEAVVATWTGLAGDRFRLDGLAEHVVVFPLETFACLLPWSPLLVALLHRQTRELIRDQQPLVRFQLIALAVAYPTVWFASGARGRYFMPLYPCIAVLVGLVIERCRSASLDTYPRRAWHQFLMLSSTLVAGTAIFFMVVTWLPAQSSSPLAQPPAVALMLTSLAIASAGAAWYCYRTGSPASCQLVILCVATFAGAFYVGPLVNVQAARWNDPTEAVAALRRQLPDPDSLVSLGPIDHRFAFYFRTQIEEIDWPTTAHELPPGVVYFCFDRHPDDTPERRSAGRGRQQFTTAGTLPFEWTEVTEICCARRLRETRQPTIVLGRVVRPDSEVAAGESAVLRR